MNSKKEILSIFTTCLHLDVMGLGERLNEAHPTNDVPKKPKRIIPNGCKLYNFYGFEVIAISEKKAKEKAYKKYQASLK